MTTTLLAAEGPSPILPHTVEIIVGTIAFLLLLVVLHRFALPQFEKIYAERTEKIEGGLKRAEEAQEQAARILVFDPPGDGRLFERLRCRGGLGDQPQRHRHAEGQPGGGPTTPRTAINSNEQVGPHCYGVRQTCSGSCPPPRRNP
jgi:hypothetical protein